jgi:hypothetical protein
MMRTALPVVGVLLIASALPGCGGSDKTTSTATTVAVQAQQRGILDAVDALQTAARAGEGQRICTTLFTLRLARSIATSSKHSCAAEVKQNLFKREESISVGSDIVVKAKTATAVIREQNGNVSTLHLLNRRGAWKIDSVTPKTASG